jgi:CRP-like cAMP-binding protein
MTFAPRPNLQRFLDRLSKRSALSEEEQQVVLNLPGQAAQVRANEDFVQLGERVDHSCLIVAGMVGRFEHDADGARQITAIHIPGDMCDLRSVVQPSTASALQALSVSTILRIPHGPIKAAAARYPGLAMAFWRDCMVDASILSEWVMNVGRRDARSRVAHLLCEMAIRLGVVEGGDDVVFDFPVSQAQMADATALTAVHVNRTLQSLRNEGLVEWRTRVVRLPRWNALMATTHFDAAYLHNRPMHEHRPRLVQAS